MVLAAEGGTDGGRYVDWVRTLRADLGEPFRLDAVIALALLALGVLELLLGSAANGSRPISALALGLIALPLAWRRVLPSAPLVVAAIVLPAQGLAGGCLAGQPVAPLAMIALALFSAGRGISSTRGLVAAGAAVATLVATRVAFDPSVRELGDVVVTLMVVPLPLLMGRWLQGQESTAREAHARVARLEREREHDMAIATEAERERIAEDLQAATADGLRQIVHRAQALQGDRADGPAARALLASIAETAREALADVRRILGILRREHPPQLTPPSTAAVARPGTEDHGTRTPTARPGDEHRRRPIDARTWDRALVAALLLGAEIEVLLVAPGDDRLEASLIAMLFVAPLLWRRDRPLAVAFAVLTAVALQSAVVGWSSIPAFEVAALVSAAFAIGAHADGRASRLGVLAFALGVVLHAAVFYPEAVIVAPLGGALFPWLAGCSVRRGRVRARDARARTAGLERSRVRDAGAAAMAERVRVARELHDGVAHNISVIAIQAAGAEAVLDRDPRRAEQCAALIEMVGREALSELTRLTRAAPTDAIGGIAWPPSLVRVDALARRARQGGLPVELRIEGTPKALPAGVDLAASRIVQEALANTAKHAGHANALVVVRYAELAVEVEISDDGAGARGRSPVHAGSGHGLIGMRERVALYHGALSTGRRSGGGFAVHARLPIGSA